MLLREHRTCQSAVLLVISFPGSKGDGDAAAGPDPDRTVASFHSRQESGGSKAPPGQGPNQLAPRPGCGVECTPERTALPPLSMPRAYKAPKPQSRSARPARRLAAVAIAAARERRQASSGDNRCTVTTLGRGGLACPGTARASSAAREVATIAFFTDGMMMGSGQEANTLSKGEVLM